MVTFELLGRNIAPLHFKTERVGKTALQASWFWPTSARFPGIWRIFSSPEDFKLTPDGLCLRKCTKRNFLNGHFRACGPKYSPLHLKTETIAEIAFRASWFWPTSDRYAGTWGIFSSPGDSKLTPDRLALHWNWQSKTLLRLTFELVGRNIAPLLFKSKSSRVFLTQIVIFTNFGSISRNQGDIFQSREH